MTNKVKGFSWQLLYLMASLITTGLVWLDFIWTDTNSAFAQSVIIPDKTLENNSRIIQNYTQNTEAVTDGVTQGNNLFHSFLEFNVSAGRTALFLTPNSINNIIVRVTGNNRSEILGRLQTTSGSTANLFFINPNGIIFGARARLSLGGSFVASTASSINFPDGNVFSATAPQSPLLTMSVPVGLQFNNTGGDIKLEQGGFLRVPSNKTLALIGGNVSLDDRSQLLAPNGQIALGGILGTGAIELNFDQNPLLKFANNVTPADISINNAVINVSEQRIGGGYIQLQGRQVTLTGRTRVFANTEGSQKSRGILIEGQQLIIKDGSQVTASTYGKGGGGDIVVKASELVQVSGTDGSLPSALFSNTYDEGEGGKLSIETGKLIVENGGQIASATLPLENGLGGQGKGGTLEINARNYVKISGASSGLFVTNTNSDKPGLLTINTSALIVQDGGQVVAGTLTRSRGNGGNLIINASDFIELSGIATNGVDTSGLFARSLGSGNAGSLSITTGKLTVRDQAQATVSALEGGDGGNLDIKADEIRLDQKGKLVAETTLGNGGNINLDLKNSLQLRNNSKISTTAGTDAEGRGNGGNININIPNGFIVAVPGENSDITANAFKGQGGDVSINAFSVFGIEFREKDSPLTNDITASSEFGINGTVEIDTPEVQPDQGLINLPTQPVEPRLAQVCQAVAGRNQDSFTITGRGGLPNNPNELLYSDAVLTDWVAVSNVENIPNTPITKSISTPTQTNIVEATGWILNPQGEVVLTVNAPNTKSPNSWQKTSACNS